MTLIKKPAKKILLRLSIFLGLFLILVVKLFGINSLTLTKVMADVPSYGDGGGNGGDGSGDGSGGDGSCGDGSSGSCGDGSGSGSSG